MRSHPKERPGARAPSAGEPSLLLGPAAMAGAAAWFASTGALIVLAAIALPHPAGVDEPGLALVAAVLVAMALIALLLQGSLPRWLFYAGCLLGSAAASAALYWWGEGSYYAALAYLCPALYAFHFFALRAALLYVAATGAMFAAVLLARDSETATVATWLATVGTLLSGGLLVAVVRRRVLEMVSGLSDAVRRDPLTNMLNRRGFEEVFDVEIERARRAGQSLSMIVVDLDRFKEINDRFGHPAGDDALRRVGAIVLESKRSWDAAARIGGEELAILSPDTDEHGAYILAERIRTSIEAAFAASGPAPLTVSFGIVTYPRHGQTTGALIQAADRALYAAKRLGRNRTVISSAEVPGILARAPRVRDEYHVELAALLNLAEALDVRDSRQRDALSARGPLRRADRPRAGPPPGGRGTHTDRRCAARRRPGGGARRAVRQGRPAQRPGVAVGQVASRDGRPDARDHGLRRHRAVDPLPPRAPRRHRLPGFGSRRRGPARGRDPRRGRRL